MRTSLVIALLVLSGCPAPSDDPDTFRDTEIEPDTIDPDTFEPDTDPDMDPDTEPDTEFIPPAAASDATLVAFHTNVGGGNEVRLYDRTTSTRIDLPQIAIPGYTTSNPSLSRDGLRIAYEAADSNGDYDVFVFDRFTNAFLSLDGFLRTGGDERRPALSKDGTRLAFDRDGSIHVIDLDGGTEVNIGSPSTDSGLSDPSLNNNGTLLVFTDATGTRGGSDVVLWDVSAGSQLAGCCGGVADEKEPGLTRDGNKVTYSSNRSDGEGGWDIFIRIRSINFFADLPDSNTGSNEGSPSFGSDGSNPTLVFSSDRDGTWDLFTDDDGATKLPFSTSGDDLGATLN